MSTLRLKMDPAYADAMCDAVVDSLDVGGPNARLRLYTGTKPALPEDAVPLGATLIATFDLENPAFSASVNGVATLLGVPIASTTLAAGTATWYRITTAAGDGAIDGYVGLSAATASLVMSPVSDAIGRACTIRSLTVRQPWRPAGGEIAQEFSGLIQVAEGTFVP